MAKVEHGRGDRARVAGKVISQTKDDRGSHADCSGDTAREVHIQ